MKTTSSTEVRHPYRNEVPPELIVGFEAYKIDPEFQWVLVVDGKIKAQMLCANTHGVLMMIRVTALKDAPQGWALAMFRHVMKECKDQGMIGFTVFLSDNKKSERRLMSIIARTGGFLRPVSGVWAAGRFDTGY